MVGMEASRARVRPYASFLLDITWIMAVSGGSLRGDEGEGGRFSEEEGGGLQASIRAWRLVPDPEMRTSSLKAGEADDMESGIMVMSERKVCTTVGPNGIDNLGGGWRRVLFWNASEEG